MLLSSGLNGYNLQIYIILMFKNHKIKFKRSKFLSINKYLNNSSFYHKDTPFYFSTITINLLNIFSPEMIPGTK